jgi:hypothetical protein
MHLQNLDKTKNIAKAEQHPNKSTPKYHYPHDPPQQPKLKMSSSIHNLARKGPTASEHERSTDHSEVFRNFANRFLQMFTIYNEMDGEVGVKKNLKTGWKWIKEVVREWQETTNVLNSIFKYCELCCSESQDCEPANILKFKQPQPTQHDL